MNPLEGKHDKFTKHGWKLRVVGDIKEMKIAQIDLQQNGHQQNFPSKQMCSNCQELRLFQIH